MVRTELSHMEMDASTIEQRFAATEPRLAGPRGLVAVAVALLAALTVMTMVVLRTSLPAKATMVLPLLFVLGLMGLGGWAGHRQRRCNQAILKAWQHVQLDEWDAARAILDDVTTRPIRSPSARGQAFMLLAALAEQANRYDRAAQIYETLLLRRMGDPLHLQQAQIALAEAKLRNQELTDAVDLLGRLEKVPMPRGLRAAHDLVRLFQQVFMGHYEDAVVDYEQRRSLYRRYLSTRAAYGYGLLAAAMHQLGRHAEAAALWLDATALIPPERLAREYEVLAPLTRAYRATEHHV